MSDSKGSKNLAGTELICWSPGLNQSTSCFPALLCAFAPLQVDLLMSERKEAKEAVQAQADTMKAAQVRALVGTDSMCV